MSRALAYTFLYVYAVGGGRRVHDRRLDDRAPNGNASRWLAFAGYAIAVVLLVSISLFKLIVLLFPLWVTAVSIVLLVGAHTAHKLGTRTG